MASLSECQVLPLGLKPLRDLTLVLLSRVLLVKLDILPTQDIAAYICRDNFLLNIHHQKKEVQ